MTRPGIVTRSLMPAMLLAATAATAHAQQGRDLPFSQQYRRPTISPYNQLNTFGSNPLLMQNVYQQQIQPQVQQQQQQIEQLSQRRQMQKLQNQVQQIGRDTSNRQIDESIRPTGHRATYMNYSHFYQMR
ncbi:MAG: hypothetical protein ACKO40_13860 [Planctomycetaceae bacterium]